MVSKAYDRPTASAFANAHRALIVPSRESMSQESVHGKAEQHFQHGYQRPRSQRTAYSPTLLQLMATKRDCALADTAGMRRNCASLSQVASSYPIVGWAESSMTSQHRGADQNRPSTIFPTRVLAFDLPSRRSVVGCLSVQCSTGSLKRKRRCWALIGRGKKSTRVRIRKQFGCWIWLWADLRKKVG